MPIAPQLGPPASAAPDDGEPAGGPPSSAASVRSTLPRRQVLRILGMGGATVLVAGVGVGSYRIYDTAALTPGHGHAYDAWQHWHDDASPLGVVAAAILAANPHNTQPWLFHVTETTIDVLLDPGRNIGSVDPYRREQHVGLGCALENLALACRARGLRPDIAVLPDGPNSRRVAHVDLTPTAPQPDDRYEAIGNRHTNRGPTNSGPSPPRHSPRWSTPLSCPA